jgi:tetratricopeptide (TPR) repeat protein
VKIKIAVPTVLMMAISAYIVNIYAGIGPFQTYMKNRSPANFIRAFREYETAVDKSEDMSAAIYLANMHRLEIEEKLEILGSKLESLKNGQKFQYANLLLKMNRFDESVAIYQDLNKRAPQWSCPWRHKGEAYWRMGELDKAVESLEKAIETRETHYDAYVMLAEVLSERGDNQRALEVLERGLQYYSKDIEDPEREVDNVDVQFLYLELLKKNGKKEEYQEQLKKLRKISPHDQRLGKGLK